MRSRTLILERGSPVDSENLLALYLSELIDEQIDFNPDRTLLDWCFDYRKIRGRPFTLDEHKFMELIYKDTHPEKIIKKAAQCGASEYFVSESFYVCDQLGSNVLYAFPAKTQLEEFSQARVNPAIEESPYLSKRVEGLNNVRLKRIGERFIYFRGTQTIKDMKSTDADVLYVDEYDEMNMVNLEQGYRRLGNSSLQWIRWASTPTVPDYGIDKLYKESDQRVWMVKCPCGRGEHKGWQELDFFKNVDKENAKVVCQYCKGEIDRLAQGLWVAKYPSRDRHGYHINKLMMARTNIKKLIEASKKTVDYEIEEFFHSDLGLAYAASGSRLTTEILRACKRDYIRAYTLRSGYNVMGIDVGTLINWSVSTVTDTGKMQKVNWGTVRHFEELDTLIRQYNVSAAVCDIRPETRKAKELRDRWKKSGTQVWLAEYDTTGNIHDHVLYEEDRIIRLNRTEIMDDVAARYRSQFKVLPKDCEMDPELFDQLKAPVRTKVRRPSETRQTGLRDKPRFRYVETGPDHYYHTDVYEEAAARLLPRRGMIQAVVV